MVIEVEGLSRSYRKGTILTPVLRDVSFRVDEGEFVAVMGRSGSGKSTLLNILGFLDRPDGGTYRFGQTDYALADDDTLSAIRSKSIGLIFQQFHLLERATSLQNVMLPLVYTDDAAGDGAERAERALEAVGLAHRGHHFPGELSGGEQQRVATARALINDPALILADEPTGNLDAASASQILDILGKLTVAGRTVVLVTHDDDVARRADRVLLLNDGRIGNAGLV